MINITHLLDAESARKLAIVNSTDNHVKDALEKVTMAVKNGLFSIKLYNQFWNTDSFNRDYAYNILQELGYSVEEATEFDESQQRSIKYTLVLW